MAGIDLFALYRRVRRPLLIARALRPNPPVPGPPSAEVAGVDATHGMLLERPGEIADLVADFAARVGEDGR
ncbi:hypothetical protein [Streptomyces sp. NPDC059788]|uniref:hypothetical protein n=1 Tax=Streptomyces sp. NPDC059788 TaxID=3346948 RepID=UPI003661E09C